MKKQVLLSRDEFREGVFERDHHKCVVCPAPAKDAHHIIERRLFNSPTQLGGYFLDNGASLCAEHHIKAETTELSCEEIREAAGIEHVVIPEHLYDDGIYTKWGDMILTNKQRIPGELFEDESVQKILKQGNMLQFYTHLVKYPRSYHVPWHGWIGKDDKVATTVGMFDDEIVMTEKLDGENTTMYFDHLHARSMDSQSHWTQSWVRNFHNNIKHEIPETFRLCGENLFAKHSIKYTDLETYFYLFSVWEKYTCLSWEDTETWAKLLNLVTVPVIFKGKWTDKPEKIHKLWTDNYDEKNHEGYTIRSAKAFHYSAFRFNLGKYVRNNHVTTSTHWKWSNIEQNELRKVK